MRRFLLPLLMMALLGAPAHGATTVIPVAHVELVMDGTSLGEYLVADSFDDHEGPILSASLLEAPEGVRLLEIDRLDREEGLKVQRLEDLTSGWWVEMTKSFGFTHLGDPADYASPMEWSLALRDRELRERAPKTVSIQLSDGRAVQWVIPFGEPETGEEARRTAIAELATIFATTEIPSTTSVGLEILARLEESEDHPSLTADDLFSEVWKAYSAATGVERPPRSKVIRHGRLSERSADMLHTLERKLPGPEDLKSP